MVPLPFVARWRVRSWTENKNKKKKNSCEFQVLKQSIPHDPFDSNQLVPIIAAFHLFLLLESIHHRARKTFNTTRTPVCEQQPPLLCRCRHCCHQSIIVKFSSCLRIYFTCIELKSTLFSVIIRLMVMQ